jgi:hypothetical protein
MFRPALLLLCAALLPGCNLEVGYLDGPEETDLLDQPSRTLVNTAATGLLIGAREGLHEPNGYVSFLGVLGRESYNLDVASDNRYVLELLAGPEITPGGFGRFLWTQRYRNIRNANNLLQALDRLPEGQLDEAEKEGMRGFAKTIMAHDHLLVINSRGDQGAVVHRGEPPDQVLPILPPEAVHAAIAGILDEAWDHLNRAGDKFSFDLSPGFAGFDTPAAFAQFNRGLRARVAIYAGDFDGALTALQGSFVPAPGSQGVDLEDLDRGVYHFFSTATGDEVNELNYFALWAHPSTHADALLQQGNDQKDDRVLRKLEEVSPDRAGRYADHDLQSVHRFTGLYREPDARLAILRSEELLLLRAEAYIGKGDLGAATQDLNAVRTASGKLKALDPLADATAAIDALLYERRYSLLFEGGHRWIDMRRYGRLDRLPIDHPSHRVHAFFPIPQTEQDARLGLQD